MTFMLLTVGLLIRLLNSLAAYPMSVLSCAKLALEAIEEVEPEVTAAAAAAMEVEVDKAVIEEAAEEDPAKVKKKVIKTGNLLRQKSH